jgi:hypothetical protein
MPPAAGAQEADGETASADDRIRRCALLNQQLWLAEPSVVVNAAYYEHPAQHLMDCISEAHDGDTIGLRGDFNSAGADTFFVELWSGVRLLGMPGATPYRFVHAAGRTDAPGPRMAQLRRFEQDSAAALGFPGASIHVERNCV